MDADGSPAATQPLPIRHPGLPCWMRIQSNVPAGPVLLVDDMVDSKWTLTVTAFPLTSHGSGLVYPLALASTANADE